MAHLGGGGARVVASVACVVGLAGAVGACSSSTEPPPSVAVVTTSTTAAPGTTAPDKMGDDGIVDLHYFDGTYGTRKFTAVACAIQDFEPVLPQRFQAPITTGTIIKAPPPTPAPPGTILKGPAPTPPPPLSVPGQPPGTTLGTWNRVIGCGPSAGPGHAFDLVSSLTIDGSSITVRFFDATCVGTMTTEDEGVNDETAVHIDQVTCDGTPAPPVDVTLQREGDNLIADGRELEPLQPNDPALDPTGPVKSIPPGGPVPVPTTAGSATATIAP
jgi:hypothetical protein